jgi:LCP family protein required for cell wall assembly
VAGAGAALVLLVAGWIVFLIVRLEGTIYVPLPPTPTPRSAAATATLAVAAAASAQPTTPPTQKVQSQDLTESLPAGRINVLVLGTDKRPDDPDHYARSDTLLLANVDTISDTVRIMSIPRDLIVDIPDYGPNKINAAYLFGEYYQLPGGGQALSVRSVSQFFNVPIDYYIAINFQGFERVVDSVGGVDIDVPYSIDDYNYPTDEQGDLYGEMHVHFDAGWQHMDGKTALEYARTRHADNDFARSKRQLQIILAVRQRALSLDLLPTLPGFIDALGGMVQTNIPFDQQLGLAQLGYKIDASDIVTTSIDSSMILPATLPDGSEGLKLNEKVARPVMDEFFGRGQDAGSDQLSAPEAVPTSSGEEGTPTAVPTRVSSRRKP